MVTLILLFIFLAPRKINFKDKPAAPQLHQNQVIAYSDGHSGFIYEVPASLVPSNATALQPSLAQALQPVAGPVQVTRYLPLHDAHGKLLAYRVWINRPSH